MKRILILVLIVGVVAALGVGAYMRFGASRTQAASDVSTATVQRGTLAATINAAGNVTAHQQADLSFAGGGGTVTAVNVNPGDRVQAGEVLAQLGTADLNLQLRNAQVNLKIAQDKLAQTQNPSTSEDIANARAQVDSAQAAYDKLVAGPDKADLAAAQSAVASAQASYDAAVKSAGTSNSQLESVAAAFEKARVALQQAQAAYDKVAWRADVAMTSQAQTLESATIDYDQAKANYEAQAATAGANAASTVAGARSQLQQAQANLSKLKTQVTQADLAAAQATLTQAKNNLATLLAGPDANTLDIAQNGVDQAQIALDQAQLSLQQAEIVAPFDGVVTQVNIKLGQNIGGGQAAIQIADLDHLEIIVNMSEVDINRIKVGQDAQITLDALPDTTLQGTVTQIAPAGVLSQGVVNYPVTVSITPPFDGVKTGMTASPNIVVEQRDNVLMVPNRAVRSQGRQRFVTVLFEGQQMQIPVQTGLSNDTMTEIVSGLKEGDAVVISSTTTVQPRAGGPGGFGGPGFIGR
jgi:HlyD family secretion protein